jgi:lipopolysaccharide biosynthesis regulator YciM
VRGWLRAWRARRGHGPRDADEGLRQALLRVLEDDLDAAEELLSGIVRADSERTFAYLALGALYRRRGEIGRAIRLHQNLLLRRDLPDAVREDALRGLAGDFQRGGFLQRAIAAWEEVLERRPRDRAALAALARLEADARDHERAIELERRLARLEGRDPKAREAELLVGAAETAHAEGRSDDARKALRRALRRDPACAAAWARLGELEAERGRNRRALAAWRRVPALDRRLAARVYPRLEATFAALGRPRAYEELLRELLEERPGDVSARLALTRALAARGATEDALAEVGDLVDRSPEDLRAHATRGRVLLEAGRDAEAAKALDALLEVLERRGFVAPPSEALQ